MIIIKLVYHVLIPAKTALISQPVLLVFPLMEEIKTVFVIMDIMKPDQSVKNVFILVKIVLQLKPVQVVLLLRTEKMTVNVK